MPTKLEDTARRIYKKQQNVGDNVSLRLRKEHNKLV